jgi:hypothetical protein
MDESGRPTVMCMQGIELTDEQIMLMTPVERRDLIERLARPVAELIPTGAIRRNRRIRLGLMIFGTIALIPWIVYLVVTLPNIYVAQNWALTWVGFDVLLLAMMATTVVLGLLRRQLLILTAFATGVLLICDAWFDITTAAADDVWVSVLAAVCGELPLAFVLITGTLRLIRVMASRFWMLQPGMHLWQVELPLPRGD